MPQIEGIGADQQPSAGTNVMRTLRALGWIALGILIVFVPVVWDRAIEARRDAQRLGTTGRLAQLKLALHNYHVQYGSHLDVFDDKQSWAERLLPIYGDEIEDPQVAPSRYRVDRDAGDPSWRSMVLVDITERPLEPEPTNPAADKRWAIFAIHESGIDWRSTDSMKYADFEPRLKRELNDYGYVAFLTSNGIVGAFTPYGIRLSAEFPELARLGECDLAD